MIEPSLLIEWTKAKLEKGGLSENQMKLLYLFNDRPLLRLDQFGDRQILDVVELCDLDDLIVQKESPYGLGAEARPGLEVVYTGMNGYDIQRKNCGLDIGKVYTIRDVDVSQSSTSIYLEGISGGFNSVMFNSLFNYEQFVKEHTED